MLFHSFDSQAERRMSGGGDFIEFAFCRADRGTPVGELVSGDAAGPLCWNNSSLYLRGNDWGEFCDAYGDLITGGTYANLETGPLDECGINYFSPEQTDRIISRLRAEKPKDHEPLLRWLEQGSPYNGFYVLGL